MKKLYSKRLFVSKETLHLLVGGEPTDPGKVSPTLPQPELTVITSPNYTCS